jgi:hypothetical protein
MFLEGMSILPLFVCAAYLFREGIAVRISGEVLLVQISAFSIVCPGYSIFAGCLP